MTAIRCFGNPFTIANKKKLYCLSSGVPCSDEVEEQVLSAEATGKNLKDAFIQERFQDKPNKYFFDKNPRNKLLTMEAGNKRVKLSTTQGKVLIFSISYSFEKYF